MLKVYKDLTITDMRALFCVLKPKYKSIEAQYRWINKNLHKILGDRYGLNPNFEFSTTSTQVFINIFSNDNKTTLVCNHSDLLK